MNNSDGADESPAAGQRQTVLEDYGDAMRKLKIFEHISLDGVIQHSADDNDFPYGDWTALTCCCRLRVASASAHS